MRKFYRVHSRDEIPQKPSEESRFEPPRSLGWPQVLPQLVALPQARACERKRDKALGWTAGGYPAPAYKVPHGPDHARLTLPLVAADFFGERPSETLKLDDEDDRRSEDSSEGLNRAPDGARKYAKVPDSAR